jgi:hypothetical protein
MIDDEILQLALQEDTICHVILGILTNVIVSFLILGYYGV